MAKAELLLESIELIRFDASVLRQAARMEPLALRSLDAIHLAAAQTLGTDLEVLVTYDRRMAGAARDLGMAVESPGANI